jgi:valyl-tRNA synthetase
VESKVTRRQSHALLIEVLDEALRLLPPTVPTFTKLKIYAEPTPNLQPRKVTNVRERRSDRNKEIR